MNYKNVKVDELEILIYFENPKNEEKIITKTKKFITSNNIKAYVECNTDGLLEVRFLNLPYDKDGANEVVRIYDLVKTCFNDLSVNIGVFLNKFIGNHNLAEINSEVFLSNLSY
jgi:hypothetical protein